MKSLCLLLLSIALVLALSRVSDARMFRTWTDQELLAKSELAVIATPVATHDTPERGPLPGDERQPVVGVQTDFAVTSILKGLPTVKTVRLHHYRADKLEVPNAPTFVAFDPKAARAYRLYLVRQADGSYAPAAGQEDPGLSIREEYVE